MRNVYTLLLFLMLSLTLRAQQQILLLAENFESPSNTMLLNGTGVGSNTGSNRWIINNEFNGAPVYPNTPPQDSIVSGTITNAPYSTYLHIHDAGTTSVSNANWNPAQSSDRFTYIDKPFCTLGMTNVTFTFFWICEGSADAYGEVYYRANGGPWIKTGQPKYYNQSKWKYEVIQDPAFNNVEELQLGFRWVNNTGGTTNVSFGVDDIIAVGTYDNVNNPVHITITSVSPLQVCQDNFLLINWKLSAPLCDATYQIQMSDKNGNFGPNPYNGGVFNIFAPDTAGAIGFQVPKDSLGNCFKVRLVRMSPQPYIVGQASVCFAIIDCPEQVITQSAPVMNDPDTTCILSVIDVKFLSFGVFNNTNNYIAELSDSTGSFANPFFLGKLGSNKAFPGPPGNISGLIPQNVPPGCGYYIRVRSTSPAVVGNVIGPFCLVRCDELTNNHTDLHFCIPAKEHPLCDTFRIQPNYWNNQANYDTCNKWTIELRSMMDFSLVNSGGLGVYKDSLGGYFQLCMPSVRDSLPVPPGSYYMRIVSNCSNQPWNQTGSVIRITIGAPDTTPPLIIMPDTVHCNLGLVALYVNPFKHPPSDYEWLSNGLNNGLPFIWPYNPLLIDFTGAPINDYTFYVREINFGCSGPWAQKAKLTIIGEPDVDISGPTQVCLGDTVNFKVGYLKETYYNWDAPPGVKILEEGNSEVSMIFDTLGDFTISNFSLNECGSDSDFYNIKVVTLYQADAGPDKQLCAGGEVTLKVETDYLNKVLFTQDTAKTGKQGAMFNLIAHSDVIIDSFAVKFLNNQIVQAEIYSKKGTYKGFEQQPGAWTSVGGFYNFQPNPPGQFTVIPGGVTATIAAGETAAFYITTVNSPPVINMAIGNTTLQQEAVFASDGILDFTTGVGIDYPFGNISGGLFGRILNCRVYYRTKGGLHYLWSTGDTTAQIQFTPQQSGQYTVMVYDTSGCKNSDSVYVTVFQPPIVSAGPDTLVCDGENYLMPATSSAGNVLWSPGIGLNNPTLINPMFNHPSSVMYVLTATDSNGCIAFDTVNIDVKNCLAYIEVPQAFTPNGDGNNDYFTIFGNNIAEYEIRIYNRWGELVYASTDLDALNNLSKGWDGTHKGVLQNIGTFVWYLTAKDIYGKSYEKKGNLTLIR
ncbi:MAG: gliding motility-associated C-terminal domain-containing protein [Chitinophagales bacterium]|nr:gliding motility-associated C-terminal domain-containing protein [Chitinophagales bacterium]